MQINKARFLSGAIGVERLLVVGSTTPRAREGPAARTISSHSARSDERQNEPDAALMSDAVVCGPSTRQDGRVDAIHLERVRDDATSLGMPESTGARSRGPS
jgi:hypothetical protein